MLDTSARVLDVAHEELLSSSVAMPPCSPGSSTGSRERGQGSASSVGPAGRVTA